MNRRNRNLVLPVVLAVVLAGLGGIAWLAGSSTRSADDPAAARASSTDGPSNQRGTEPAPVPADPAPTVTPDVARTSVETETTPIPEPRGEARPSSRPPLEVLARVLDIRGVPLAGVPLRASEAEDILGTSDGSGNVRLELPRGAESMVLEVAGPNYTTVRACQVRRAETELANLIVAAPAVAVAGRVLDESGVGIADAHVSANLPRGLLRDFPHPLDRNEKRSRSALTDESGAFRLEAVAVTPDSVLRAQRDGYTEAELPVPSTDRPDLIFELRAIAAEAEQIRGRVFLPDGSPAPRATVRYAWYETHTAADGSFALEHVSELGPEVALAAGLEGYGTAVIENFANVLDASAPRAPTGLELTLTDSSQQIAGRVIDEDGDGRSGWWVGIRAGVSTSSGQIPPPWAEALNGTTETKTDDEGRFELSGLFDREYSIWAYDTESLQAIEPPDPIRAGTRNVELVARTDGLFESVSGRVFSRSGVPLAGVTVTVQRNTFEFEFGSASVGGQGTATDEEGRFTLRNVPVEGVGLKVSGSEVVPEVRALAETDDVDELRLSVARRCHFKLEVNGNETAGLAFQLLDEAGSALRIFSFQANGWSASTSAMVREDGLTEVYAVSEDAKTVALSGKGNEVARRPVLLVPDVVNEIRIDLSQSDD